MSCSLPLSPVDCLTPATDQRVLGLVAKLALDLVTADRYVLDYFVNHCTSDWRISPDDFHSGFK